MSVAVIDSGMGGLDVAARLYEQLRCSERGVAVRFVNIRPAPGRRFEDHGSRAHKLSLLDEELTMIEQRLATKLLALACNTLSVIVSETEFHARHGPRLISIEPLGAADCCEFVCDEVFVLGTELTISAGAHRRALLQRGIDGRRIVEQPCPGLANSIQDDHASERTQALLSHFVAQAAARRRYPRARACVMLACSHYGYLRQRFVREFADRGVEIDRVLCPSDALVDTLTARLRDGAVTRSPRGPSIELFSRHSLAARERDNFVELIAPISADTAEALARVKPLL